MKEGIFVSDEHRERFAQAIQSIGKIWESGRIDPEYGAALYIFTSSASTWERASGYVSSTGILVEKLLKQVDFGGAYTVLIELAGNLFNGNIHVDPVEFMRLDENNFQIVLHAIRLRRYGLRFSDVTQKVSDGE